VDPSSGQTDRLGCRQVRKVLQAFLDGEIDPRRGEIIAAHLESCSRCRVEADTLHRVIAELRQRRPDLDLDAYTRLSATIDRLISETERHEGP